MLDFEASSARVVIASPSGLSSGLPGFSLGDPTLSDARRVSCLAIRLDGRGRVSKNLRSVVMGGDGRGGGRILYSARFSRYALSVDPARGKGGGPGANEVASLGKVLPSVLR